MCPVSMAAEFSQISVNKQKYCAPNSLNARVMRRNEPAQQALDFGLVELLELNLELY